MRKVLGPISPNSPRIGKIKKHSKKPKKKASLFPSRKSKAIKNLPLNLALCPFSFYGSPFQIEVIKKDLHTPKKRKHSDQTGLTEENIRPTKTAKQEALTEHHFISLSTTKSAMVNQYKDFKKTVKSLQEDIVSAKHQNFIETALNMFKFILSIDPMKLDLEHRKSLATIYAETPGRIQFVVSKIEQYAAESVSKPVSNGRSLSFNQSVALFDKLGNFKQLATYDWDPEAEQQLTLK